VIAFVRFAAAIGGGALTAGAGLNLAPLCILASVFGACLFPLYSLCVAHANDHAKAEDFVTTSGGLLLVYGIAAAIGVVIAAIAGLLGFSLAVGALFAGLVFSRDPEAVRVEASFIALYEMLVPFFFIVIGLQVNWGVLNDGLAIGGVFLVFAVAGKFVGTWVPARLTCTTAGASLIAVSMVPRAEITLVIAREGAERLFSAPL